MSSVSCHIKETLVGCGDYQVSGDMGVATGKVRRGWGKLGTRLRD